ncbi:MAG: tetratricopeptide repeat protein [Methylococcales bacterium]
MKQEMYPEAAELFSRAFSLDPSDVEVINNLGYALLMSGELASAEKQS